MSKKIEEILRTKNSIDFASTYYPCGWYVSQILNSIADEVEGMSPLTDEEMLLLYHYHKILKAKGQEAPNLVDFINKAQIQAILKLFEEKE